MSISDKIKISSFVFKLNDYATIELDDAIRSLEDELQEYPEEDVTVLICYILRAMDDANFGGHIYAGPQRRENVLREISHILDERLSSGRWPVLEAGDAYHVR